MGSRVTGTPPISSTTALITRTREHHLVDAFVTLADTLVADYDVVDLLQSLVDNTTQLFDAAAAGILLANQRQELEVGAASKTGRVARVQ